MTVVRTGRPRFEKLIEHEAPKNSWRAQTARSAELDDLHMVPSAHGRMAFGRRMFGSWLGVIGAVVALAVVAILAVQLSAVDASPGGKALQFAGLEIRLVQASVEPGRNGRRVIVVGEIANLSDDEIAVPAVRIALLSEGKERRFWHHEPEELRLAAGSVTQFRSTSAAPPADVDRVAFRLAERRNAIAGLH